MIFDYDFMIDAFAASGIVAVVAGAVGFFLVLRGQTFAGHALSHVGFAGATGAVLIGNVLAAGTDTLWALAALGAICLVGLAAISRPLIFASLQPEIAEAKGVSLRLIGVLFLATVAIAVAESAQIVGVLLVFTLMVGPAAAAQRLTGGIWGGVALSIALALLDAWGGLTLAFYTDWPTTFWITALSG